MTTYHTRYLFRAAFTSLISFYAILLTYYLTHLSSSILLIYHLLSYHNFINNLISINPFYINFILSSHLLCSLIKTLNSTFQLLSIKTSTQI